MRTFRHLLSAVLVVLLSLSANAQPGPGTGKGQGFRINQDNTPGWSLMTSEERTAHRERMLSLTSYEECRAYVTEHHASMAARAKEKGITLPAPRSIACDRMKARGMLK